MPHRSPDWVIEAAKLICSDDQGCAFDIAVPAETYRFVVCRDTLKLLTLGPGAEPEALDTAFERHRPLIAKVAWKVRARRRRLIVGRLPLLSTDFGIRKPF